jgi:hypothetical protein
VQGDKNFKEFQRRFVPRRWESKKKGGGC